MGKKPTIDYGEVLSRGQVAEAIDTPLQIACPNEDCGVSHTPLRESLNAKGEIECRWCGERYVLRVEEPEKAQ